MLRHHIITTNIMYAVDIMVNTIIFAAKEEAVLNAKAIGEVSVVVR